MKEMRRSIVAVLIFLSSLSGTSFLQAQDQYPVHRSGSKKYVPIAAIVAPSGADAVFLMLPTATILCPVTAAFDILSKAYMDPDPASLKVSVIAPKLSNASALPVSSGNLP